MTANGSRLHPRERSSRSLFDRWARSYDAGRISPWFRYTQQLALDALELAPDSRVLDVGCGTGNAPIQVAARLPRGRAFGVDISPAMIDAARRKLSAELAGRVEFSVGSSADLPFEDGALTHVLCTNSFHHYPDPARALGEMRRVLVPGGQLVVFENAPDLSWYTWAWDRVLRVLEKGHVRYYPSRELGEMIAGAGFEKVECRVLRNELLRHGKLFSSIQLWSARKPPSPPAS